MSRTFKDKPYWVRKKKAAYNHEVANKIKPTFAESLSLEFEPYHNVCSILEPDTYVTSPAFRMSTVNKALSQGAAEDGSSADNNSTTGKKNNGTVGEFNHADGILSVTFFDEFKLEEGVSLSTKELTELIYNALYRSYTRFERDGELYFNSSVERIPFDKGRIGRVVKNMSDGKNGRKMLSFVTEEGFAVNLRIGPVAYQVFFDDENDEIHFADTGYRTVSLSVVYEEGWDKSSDKFESYTLHCVNRYIPGYSDDDFGNYRFDPNEGFKCTDLCCVPTTNANRKHYKYPRGGKDKVNTTLKQAAQLYNSGHTSAVRDTDELADAVGEQEVGGAKAQSATEFYGTSTITGDDLPQVEEISTTLHIPGSENNADNASKES